MRLVNQLFSININNSNLVIFSEPVRRLLIYFQMKSSRVSKRPNKSIFCNIVKFQENQEAYDKANAILLNL
jgi:hypothetical protein